MIVDASVILRAFFKDEAQEEAQALIGEHVAGRIRLIGPELLPLELCNAVWQAERRKRVTTLQADEILQAIQDLDITTAPVNWMEILPFARRFETSAYDAAYLALAKRLDEKLITGDEHLYNSVRKDLNWVIWIENYRPTSS